MIYAIVSDGHGHKSVKTFVGLTALHNWLASQRRGQRGLTVAATTTSNRPSIRRLEQRADACGLVVTRADDGFRWDYKRDGARGFATRPEALRSAYDAGVLGE